MCRRLLACSRRPCGAPSQRLEELFAGHRVKTTRQIFNFRYKSAGHWLEIFKTYYGPPTAPLRRSIAGKQDALQSDLIDLLERA